MNVTPKPDRIQIWYLLIKKAPLSEKKLLKEGLIYG